MFYLEICAFGQEKLLILSVLLLEYIPRKWSVHVTSLNGAYIFNNF